MHYTIEQWRGAFSSEAKDDILELHALNQELLEALKTLLSSIEGKRVTVGDCNQAAFAIAKAESIK